MSPRPAKPTVEEQLAELNKAQVALLKCTAGTLDAFRALTGFTDDWRRLKNLAGAWEATAAEARLDDDDPNAATVARVLEMCAQELRDALTKGGE